MIEAGVEVDNHESDLYVPDNEVTRKIIEGYEFKGNCSRFRNAVDGEIWVDIPFSYDPWWDYKLEEGWRGYGA